MCTTRAASHIFDSGNFTCLTNLSALFLVNNDIRGLIDSVNDGSTSAFLWEWFTTKPFVDAGQIRFVRQVLRPCPLFHVSV